MKMKPTVNTQRRLQSLPRVGRGAAAIIVSLTIFTSLGLARSSQAVPMLFTLTGVTLNDGATATGSSYLIISPSIRITLCSPFRVTSPAPACMRWI
jgi:hypothetical protein